MIFKWEILTEFRLFFMLYTNITLKKSDRAGHVRSSWKLQIELEISDWAGNFRLSRKHKIGLETSNRVRNTRSGWKRQIGLIHKFRARFRNVYIMTTTYFQFCKSFNSSISTQFSELNSLFRSKKRNEEIICLILSNAKPL